MQKKGFDVNLEASARAMFTCNEPEGSGAVFKPVIINSVYDPETGLDKKGIMVGVDVIKPGLGYGFDPADTFYKFYPYEGCDPASHYGIKRSWEEQLDKRAKEMQDGK